MEKSILILDCKLEEDSFGAKDILRFLGKDLVVVRRAPDRDFPTEELESYKGLIISGSLARADDPSPWVVELLQFIQVWCTEIKKPLLGICFGHQMLARALEGQKAVQKTNTPEFGWTKIERTVDSPLFLGIQEPFFSFSSHYDEVSQLPEDFISIAKSEGCGIQAMMHTNLPFYSVQFHPEKTQEEAAKTFARLRKKGEARHILKENESQAVAHHNKAARQIFENFAQGLA